MPASRFFILLKHGRELHQRELATHFAWLCDVGFLSQATKRSYEKLRGSFVKMAMNEEQRKGRVLRAEDPRTGRLIEAMFRGAGVIRG